MVLVGIFTKLGLEKAHRPQREHMSRWAAAPRPPTPRAPLFPRSPPLSTFPEAMALPLQPGLSAGECHPGSQLGLGVQRGDGELSTGVDVRVCMWIRGVFPRPPRSLAAPTRRVLQRT